MAGSGGGRATTRLKVAIVASLEHLYPARDLLAFLELPASTYYYHRSRRPRSDPYVSVRPLIKETFERAYQSYGYRRVRIALKNQHGVHLNGKTVLKLMRQEHCICRVRRKKYRSYRGQIGKAAPNILQRDFGAEVPNEKWVTDVTEFVVAGEKLYLSPLIDLFNGEVLTYTLRSTPNLQLVIDMLKPALAALNSSSKPIIHSDQGWQYQHRTYQRMVRGSGATQSMSRKGNCLDNAVAENFFGHLKEEFIRRRHFASVEDFRVDLDLYIHWFNNERIREKLDGLSPVEYRNSVSGRSFALT
ncbi:transposase InsO family protein [Homoserinimonas aerilata]|uniref:Transposase InsO family protein n=1 Tax=Homoserinimonas aerilata TaxID=1162970 RepID=A0A542YLC7_9MICO|nr:IS3 family transposase [Homoserinimonas aerilata]TQL48879.1 transposase InsO family protein [Homoserinimonas aerilata]